MLEKIGKINGYYVKHRRASKLQTWFIQSEGAHFFSLQSVSLPQSNNAL